MNRPTIMRGLLALKETIAMSFTEGGREVLDAAISELNAMPEIKIAFHVGWKGLMANDMEAEIYGEKDGQFFGAMNDEGTWDSSSWANDGRWCGMHDNHAYDLVPNTPPLLEFWWRRKSNTKVLITTLSSDNDSDDWEPVELRVIPTEDLK